MHDDPVGRRGEDHPAVAAVAASTREEMLDLYRASRIVAPFGNLAAAALFVVSGWALLPHPPLLLWLAAAVVISLGLRLSLTEWALRRLRGERPVSHCGTAAHLLTGALWGAVLWLDLDATQGSTLWVCLTFQFAVTAGTLGGHARVQRFTMSYLLASWIVSTAGLIVVGNWTLAVGMCAFVFLVGRDVAVTGRLVSDTIKLRVDSVANAARAEWDALHDPLTGLHNRAGLLAVADAWHREDRRDRITALFIDLDHFKEVNDRLGHLAGDRLLTEVAARIDHVLRPGDVAGRLGGDEFFVLLDEELSVDAGAALAERLIASVEEPFDLDGDETYISASIGVTTVERHDATPERLLHESDHALYQAKRSGRRRAVAFDDDLQAELHNRIGLETALRKALREGSIDAWAQPLVELSTGYVGGVELLARWHHAGTWVPPSIFVPLAEEIGVADDLGYQMLQYAASAFRRWETHPVLSTAIIGVNISPRHITRGDLVADIATLIDRGMPGERLVVELTESQFTDHNRARAVFTELQTMGVRLAIDDFGAGYSSLGQMLALPVAIVKLDAGLIAGLGRDDRRTRMVGAIHELAGALGQVVVAEGVETARQHQKLLELGFTRAQGYRFCPPMPLAELESHLSASAYLGTLTTTSTS
jgi:diguanylate cyclase (GGDEF)-like protein